MDANESRDLRDGWEHIERVRNMTPHAIEAYDCPRCKLTEALERIVDVMESHPAERAELVVAE